MRLLNVILIILLLKITFVFPYKIELEKKAHEH